MTRSRGRRARAASGRGPARRNVPALAYRGPDAALVAPDHDERRRDEQLRRQVEYVSLLRSVAAAANEAASPEAALQAAVDQVCRVMRFPVGHVLIPTADRTRLVATDIWHFADGARYRGFAEATARTAFVVGTGIPGRVLAEGRPVFIPDIAAVSLPRGAAALRLALRGAFACPVMLAGEVVAVLEFFSPGELVPDAELLAVMADVGRQLGRVIERDRAQRSIRHLALHDALTDLPNRNLLDDRLGQAIARARRDEGCAALLFIDLDDFKQVNDTFGHRAGDLVLREIASRLRGAARGQDTVARIGGDEFAVVLPSTDRSGAAEAARKLRDALEAPVVVDGQHCYVGATAGIAVYPLHGTEPTDLLRHADIALYAAKNGGEGFATYDPATDESAPGRVALADELRTAIEEGQLLVHYQPEVRLRTGDVAGVESLVRWRHPKRALLLPGDFVPLAERAGLVQRLTAGVLRDAVARARAWELEGRSMAVAINVSVSDLLDREMPGRVGAAVAAAGLSPGLLRLEVTESQLLVDPGRAARNMEELGRHGVRCSLDDFGAGYASLGYLRRLPIDQLKVDRSIVAGIARDKASTAIAKAALVLGQELGLEVVAEGVEDEATRSRLIALGYEVGQGDVIARPMDPAALSGWLRGRQVVRRRESDAA